jgi:hypothetical protein
METLATQLQTAFNARDIDAFRGLLAEDARWDEDPDAPNTCHKPRRDHRLPVCSARAGSETGMPLASVRYTVRARRRPWSSTFGTASSIAVWSSLVDGALLMFWAALHE